MDLVAVASPFTASLDVSRGLQLGDDALDGSLRDPDSPRHVAHAGIRSLDEAEQDVGVIREEGPGRILGVAVGARLGHLGAKYTTPIS